jgi:oligopeptide/dipeptide ABC transporter ATP-binding protein
MATGPVLRVDNLSVNFRTPRGPLQALRNVDLTIPDRRVSGVVGESGCGKSTLISAIIRLMSDNADIVSGSIDFQGRDLLKRTKKEMRAILGDRISMVFQDPMTSLNPVHTIGRQMTDIQYRDRIGIAEKRKRAVEMLASVGIPDPGSRLGQYPHHFSGGMRQRITIAMALLASPNLLIADEPTTALDATLEVQIIHLLKELQERIGCAILFVSHHLNVIAELCDDVTVMYAGVVVESGTVRDIFHRPAHPYTMALLKCDPAVIQEKSEMLPTIPGEIPDLVDLPQGCIFASRCPEVGEICLEGPPPMVEVSPGHLAACVRRTEGEMA